MHKLQSDMKWYLICCSNPVYTLSNTCHIFPAITVTTSVHPSSAVLLDQVIAAVALQPIQETIKILTYTVLFYFDKIVS